MPKNHLCKLLFLKHFFRLRKIVKLLRKIVKLPIANLISLLSLLVEWRMLMNKQDTKKVSPNKCTSDTQKVLLKELQNMMAFFHVEQIKKQTDAQHNQEARETKEENSNT